MRIVGLDVSREFTVLLPGYDLADVARRGGLGRGTGTRPSARILSALTRPPQRANRNGRDGTQIGGHLAVRAHAISRSPSLSGTPLDSLVGHWVKIPSPTMPFEACHQT